MARINGIKSYSHITYDDWDSNLQNSKYINKWFFKGVVVSPVWDFL